MINDVAWSSISDVLAIIANMASFLCLANSLPPERYGGYVGIYGVIGPLGAFSWSGLSLLVLQRVIREKDEPQSTLNRILFLSVGQGAAAAVLAVLLATRAIEQVSTSAIVFMAIAELMIFPITQATGMFVQAIRGFAAAARLRIVVPLVRLSAVLIPYSLGMLTIRNLAIAWMIGFSMTALGCLTIVLPNLGLRPGFAKPSGTYVKTNLELSLPLTASNLQINGDKAILNYFDLARDAGFYGAAYRVITLSQLPLRTLNQALFQRFLPNEEGRLGQHLNRAKRFTTVSFSLSLVISAVIFLAAPILRFLLGEKFEESVTIVRWLVPVVPLLSISRAPLNGLLGLGKTTIRAGVIVSSAFLSMVLYFSLIPIYSWRGAAVGTVISELFLTTAGWFFLVRYQREADADTMAERAKRRAEREEAGADDDVDEGADPDDADPEDADPANAELEDADPEDDGDEQEAEEGDAEGSESDDSDTESSDTESSDDVSEPEST